MERNLFIKIIFPIMAALVALYFGSSFLQTPKQTVFLLLITLLIGITFIKPLLGILFYIAYLPFVKPSEGLSMQEFFALGFIGLLCVLWFISRSKKWSEVLEINRIERSLIILFLYMGFSLIVLISNGGTFTNWGRDLFPLLHLVLILPVIHFIDNEQDFRMAFSFFIFVLAFPIFQWFLGSLINIGLAPYFKIHWIHGTPFAMYILILLGIISFLEYRKPILLYILPAFAAIGVAVLNQPRTVWVGTAVSMLVLLILCKNKGRWMSIMLIVLIILSVFFSYMSTQNPIFIAHQLEVVRTFQYLEGDLSWQSRMAEATQSLALFFQSPLYGVGLGHQYRFWRPFVKGIGPGYLESNVTHADSANYLAKTGLIGVIIFAFLFCSVIITGIKFYNQSEDPENKMIYLLGVAGTIVAMIVCNSTPILQIRYNASALAFLIGFMFAKRKLEMKEKIENQIRIEQLNKI